MSGSSLGPPGPDPLEQKWEWSSTDPEQPETLSDLRYLADRLDLRRDILLGTRVTGAAFDRDAAGTGCGGAWLCLGGDGIERRLLLLET